MGLLNFLSKKRNSELKPKESKLCVEIKNILGNMPFGRIGEPSGVFWSNDKEKFAIVGTFGYSYWTGKSTDHNMYYKYRISVYDANSLEEINVFDLPPIQLNDYASHLPINDMAFQPGSSTVAIATGRNYDYHEEGRLLIWNYIDGSFSILIHESRNILKCKFDERGKKLYLMLYAPDDDESLIENEENNFYFYEMDRLDGEKVYINQLRRVYFSDLFDTELVNKKADDFSKIIDSILMRNQIIYEKRLPIWDVTWISNNELVAAGNNITLECWNISGERKFQIPEPKCGVEVFFHSDSKRLFVNAFRHTYSSNGATFQDLRESYLLEVDLISQKCFCRYDPKHSFTLSMSSTGIFLVRDCSVHSHMKIPSKDTIINNDFNNTDYLNIGGYDAVSGYLRIDNCKHLYFLEGLSSEQQNRNRWVCRIDPTNLEIEKLFLLDWDKSRNALMWSSGGCYIDDLLGESLILANQFYNIKDFKLFNGILTRRDLKDGSLVWLKRFHCPITAIASMSEHEIIVFALASGQIGLVSSVDGKEILMQKVEINGVSSVITSLSCNDARIAAGTIDGLVLVYEIV